MFIRFDYQSQYFVEQLAALRKNPALTNEQNNRSMIKARDHTIDLANNTVVKQNYQKFKFEALKPFETQTKIEFTDVRKLARPSTFVNTYDVHIELLPDSSADKEHIGQQDLRGEARVHEQRQPKPRTVRP